MECEHKYVHYDTTKSCTRDGHGHTYKRIDMYFCEKCLNETTATKEKWVSPADRASNPTGIENFKSFLELALLKISRKKALIFDTQGWIKK